MQPSSATDDPLALFERHRPRLFGLAYRMLGQRADAEDLVQEAWLRWHGAERAGIEQPEAWLVSVTTRLAIDRLRRLRASAWSRAMHAENRLSPADFIWPLFVTSGRGVEEPIASLPGVSRWSVDLVVARAREAAAARSVSACPSTNRAPRTSASNSSAVNISGGRKKPDRRI